MKKKYNFNSKLVRKQGVFLLLFLIFFSTTLNAQVKVNQNSERHIFYKDSLIEISYQFANCNIRFDGINKDEINLKFENLTNHKIEVNWELALNYSNRCFNCNRENDELKFSKILEPKEVIEGKCEEEGNLNHLKIFVGFVNNETPVKLKDFDIKYLVIKSISSL